MSENILVESRAHQTGEVIGFDRAHSSFGGNGLVDYTIDCVTDG
jgi:hypothetical protein